MTTVQERRGRGPRAAAQPGAPPRPRRARLGPLDLAAAHQHAHRAAAAAAARRRRGARVAVPAAQHRPGRRRAVLPRPPAARAVARPRQPLRRLLLAVVLGDLPAAVRQPGRLRAAPLQACTWPTCAPRRRARPRAWPGCPSTAPSRSRPPPRRCWPPPAPCCGRRRYRTRGAPRGVRGRASAGELRETGNLVFHLSLVGVLVAVGVGGLLGVPRAGGRPRRGRCSPTPRRPTTRWDPGALVDADDLPPFSFVLDALHVRFDDDSTGNQFGAPRSFSADVSVTDAPGDAARRAGGPGQRAAARRRRDGLPGRQRLRPGGDRHRRRRERRLRPAHAVPRPGRQLHLHRRGQGPRRDHRRRSACRGCCCPPLADPADSVPVSVFPDARNPELLLNAYTGDLGLDDGVPAERLRARHVEDDEAAWTPTGRRCASALRPRRDR